MARKKKAKAEEEFVAAVDLPVDMEINIPTVTGIPYGMSAFGTDLTNYKNYIYPESLEQTKKEMIPAIGSILTDRGGKKFKFVDLRTREKVIKSTNPDIPDETRTVYIFDLEEMPAEI